MSMQSIPNCYLKHAQISSYVQYSTIAARAVRSALKGEAKEAGAKRGETKIMEKRKLNVYCFRYCQHQVPEVGGWQAPGQEGINVNGVDRENVEKR